MIKKIKECVNSKKDKNFINKSINHNIISANKSKKFLEKFNGNEGYKKIVNSSAFCSENNNIVSDNYKIKNNEKIAIIPPIGGG